MTISLEEARSIVREYQRDVGATWFDEKVFEKPDYWFFAVGYIGSSGVIVERSDGRLYPMGSGLSREEIFWGHENGFSPETVNLTVLEVQNLEETSQILTGVLGPCPPPKAAAREFREALVSQLSCTPLTFEGVRLWLRIPWFKEAQEQDWFTFSLEEHIEK